MTVTETPSAAHGKPEARPARILADYLTPSELAVELGISERALSRWHAMRQGPPRVLIGRTPYYKRSSVERWLAGREDGFGEARPALRRRAARG
jgi:hypothetical protein